VTSVDRVIAVVKAYTTRVGEGPMPTEDKGEVGEYLRTQGGEFGSVTGRPRRCGWLDMVALRYSMHLSGSNSIALTKLDVLTGRDEIKICTAYKFNGARRDRFSSNPLILEECRPVFETLPGWKDDISGCTTFESLPEAAQNYVRYVEQHAGAPVKLIGVGANRSQVISRGF